MAVICQFKDPVTEKGCEEPATQTKAVGMAWTAQDPAKPGHVGTFYYVRLYAKHHAELSSEAESA